MSRSESTDLVRGFGTDPTLPDEDKPTPIEAFHESKLYEKWERNVVKSDNDFILVIAAASKSTMSGIGKTTLGINASRHFDLTSDGFDAETKATLNATEFAREMLADPSRVPDMSSIIYDEGQGTLAGGGTDARRSMADSVMNVTTALSTMRFRQLTSIIITQSTKWIDKRVDEVMDALVLIQPSDGRQVVAEVFDSYYNDLEQDSTRYVEHLCTITWEPLPEDDPDYKYLHELKEKSATNSLDDEDDEEDQGLPRDQQIQLAQHLREMGHTAPEIVQSPFIEYDNKQWVYDNTTNPDKE